MEKLIKATMASQENNMAIVINIEIHMGQSAKQLAERQSGKFSANAQTNPREHSNEIVAECGKITGERDGKIVGAEKEKDETERERDEKERKKEKKVRKKKLKIKREVFLKKIYYIPRLLKKKRRNCFDNLLPKNYFAGNFKQDSTLQRFRKNRSYIEERNIELENKYNAIIQKGFP